MTKISALTSLGDGLAVGDQFIVRDIDDAGTPNKSVTVSGITRGLDRGALGAPAIAFASDKNTGLYSPGEDTLALVTAGANRLHITSGGLVGLGTSGPSAKLDVEAANFVGGPAIGARYNTSNPRLGFNIANSNGFVYIGSNTNNKLSVDTPTYDLTGHTASQLRLDGGQLVFNNAPSGTAGNDISFTNRLTITSGGLVGIGTTSPTNYGAGINTLSINGTAGSVADVYFNGTRQGYIGTFASNELVIDTAGAAIPLKLQANATERARIRGDGTFEIKGAGTAGSSPAVSVSPGAPANSATLDSSGRLLVGTTTAPTNGELLTVRNASTGTEAAGIRFESFATIADDASITISIPHAGMIMLTNQNTGHGALVFATYHSSTITIIADPGGIIATNDEDLKLCIFKSSVTNNITVKNRLGSEREIGIGKLTLL